MSYEILYDTAFIRLPNGLIPMILSGSNNCTVPSFGANGRVYERRTREWWSYIPSPLVPYSLHSESEMQTAFDNLSEKNAGREAFKRGGKWLMWDDMGVWFRKAAAKALPLEKWLAYNPCASFEVALVLYDRESWKVKTRYGKFIHSSQELEDWLSFAASVEVPKYHGEYSICVEMSFGTEEPLKNPPQAGPVVVKYHDGYVEKCEKTAWGTSIVWTPEKSNALVFADAEAAKAEIGPYWEHCRVLRATRQMKPKNYILQLTDYYGGFPGQYLKKMTRNRIYGSYNADGVKRFASVREATKCADGIRKRYRVGSKFFVVNIISGEKEEINFANC